MILVCDHRGEGLEQTLAPLARAGFELTVSRCLRETREALGRVRPAMVVVEPLAGGGQVELEEIERLRGADGQIPVLVVCDRAAPGPTLEAARAMGPKAWDLVHRDAPLEELVLRIERLMSQASEWGELDDLRHAAAHDDRTDLLRPRVFQRRLVEHFSAAQRHGLDLALVLIDLDDFGLVNKVFDHTVGDRLIERVGEAVRGMLRAEDVAGRLGGDEFAVVLPYTNAVEAAHAVVRLRDAIHALSGTTGEPPRHLDVSASIGFETYDGADLSSVDELRRHAEVALRRAKERGGNAGIYFRSLARE